MQLQTVSLKAGIWGAVVGSIHTMILGFGWGGWTTNSTAQQVAARQADAAVTGALVPICVAGEKADGARGKLGELTAITSSYEQTEFVMKAGWATFPGQVDPNRAVAEGCAAALLKTAVAK
jgi:dienelactone hydrolase